MKKILLCTFIILLIPFTAWAKPPGLDVPYTTQIPNGYWANPWSNACEESSIIMVEEYYKGKTGLISRQKAIALISPFFIYENNIFGNNSDSNSYRTQKLIKKYTSFNANIKINPTLEEIKQHLRYHFPIISLHYGFDLINPNLHFRALGSSYHMMVITGYDDKNGTFITNDPGDDKTGYNKEYSYNNFLKTLGDFDHVNKKVDKNIPTVLLSYPKLVKTKDSNKIYYVEDGNKYYISHPQIIILNNWKWNWIKEVSTDWLSKLKNGSMLTLQNPTIQNEKLVNPAGSHNIFLIKDNQKFYITHPNVFTQRGWSWGNIKSVNSNYLSKYPTAGTI